MLRSQVGIREVGNNRGECEKYLHSVGLGAGNPYCYAGQYWCIDIVRKEKHPLLKTGLAWAGCADAMKRGLADGYSPHVGDLIFWRYTDRVNGHVERIVEIRNDGWVVTVGLNVSIKGEGTERDGGGNDYKLRNIKHKLGAMRIRAYVGI